VKVIRAKVLGFCMGVRRAVAMAAEEAEHIKDSSRCAYTLGPLIHNQKVLDELKALGIGCLDSPQSLTEDCCQKGCSVIIRAHGIDPITERELYSKGVRVIDATCPNVKASQLKAEELSREGYCIFLAGEEAHAEIEGILGYVKASGGSFCEVVSCAEEARKKAKKLYSINCDSRTAILGQTTISEKEYEVISEAAGLFFPNLEVIQTICAATRERQQALIELTDQVDVIIVAGGKDSANTRRLFTIAQKSGKPCALVEESSQIPADFFNYETVGLCAGASAPDSVIDEIEEALIRGR